MYKKHLDSVCVIIVFLSFAEITSLIGSEYEMVKIDEGSKDSTERKRISNDNKSTTPLKNNFVNLLEVHRLWSKFSQKEKVKMQWNKHENLVVESREGTGRIVYRHKLPLSGARLRIDFRFIEVPVDETIGGLMFYGIATSSNEPLTIAIWPKKEVMQIGEAKKQFRRLIEEPYRYDIECVFRKDVLEVYWKGRQRAKSYVEYETNSASLLVFTTNGTVAVNKLFVSSDWKTNRYIIRSREYKDVTLEVNKKSMVGLPSEWVDYFGTHYASSPEEAGLRFRTVRSYGGTHVGVDSAEERKDSPVHVGPFTGKKVQVGLDDFRSQSRWAKNPPAAKELIPELIKGCITAIYGTGCFMHDMDGDGIDDFDKDLAYWTLRLIHENYPEAKDYIVWQHGNEIVSSHWNPRNLRREDKHKPPPKDVELWNRGYDIKWKLDYYIRAWLGPAVEVMRKVGEDVYGDPEVLICATGSMNPYTKENLWFLSQLMDAKFYGDRAPSLKEEKVWRHIDLLTIHYISKNVTRLHNYTEKYLQSGKVKGIWITEEHGRAGRGPVTILNRGLHFMTWVAKDRLNADQARLVWWGESERAGGSGKEMMRVLGKFLSGRPLFFSKQEINQVNFYILSNRQDEKLQRILVVIIPGDSKNYIDLNLLNINMPEGSARHDWQIKAVQYSSLALPEEVQTTLSRNGNRLNIELARRITEPFVLYLKIKNR